MPNGPIFLETAILQRVLEDDIAGALDLTRELRAGEIRMLLKQIAEMDCLLRAALELAEGREPGD